MQFKFVPTQSSTRSPAAVSEHFLLGEIIQMFQPQTLLCFFCPQGSVSWTGCWSWAWATPRSWAVVKVFTLWSWRSRKPSCASWLLFWRVTAPSSDPLPKLLQRKPQMQALSLTCKVPRTAEPAHQLQPQSKLSTWVWPPLLISQQPLHSPNTGSITSLCSVMS